jgi:amino acid transporter
MASGSRMIYAMARDNVFFGNVVFRRVTVATSVPVPAVLLVAVLGVLGESYSESLEQLLAAAAVLPALIYLITVVTYAVRRNSLAAGSSHFSLGRWGGIVSGLAIAWLILIIAILTIPREFRNATWVSAAVCGIGVVLYWVLIRRRIARGKAGMRIAD